MKRISNKSDFAISGILGKAIKVLRENYWTIAVVNLCMFVVVGLSSTLASYFQGESDSLSVVLGSFFALLYAALGLFLFKIILLILNREKKTNRMDYLPTLKELVRYLLAVLFFLLLAIGLAVVVLVVAFPLVYAGFEVSTVLSIGGSICVLVVSVFFLRVAFYPFFILDQGAAAWASIKESYHITKKYFFKIALVALLFLFIHVLQGYVGAIWGPYAGAVVGVLNAFFITPFYVVTLGVTYKRMLRVDEKKEMQMSAE